MWDWDMSDTDSDSTHSMRSDSDMWDSDAEDNFMRQIKMPTLYNICLERVAHLLDKAFWHVDNEQHVSNPFADSCGSLLTLPPSAVDDLITHVLQAVKSSRKNKNMCGPLKKMHLYHLIDTGRVQNFNLQNATLSYDDLSCILMQLSRKCQNLTSIIVKDISFTDDDDMDRYSSSTKIKNKKMKVAKALECVLSAAPRLTLVDSSIKFDIKALRNATDLKQLSLSFYFENYISDILKVMDGHLCSNNSLRFIKIEEDARGPFSYIDSALVLKYCKKLAYFEHCDLTESFKYLHAEELYAGTLNAQYGLEKLNLGLAIHFKQEGKPDAGQPFYVPVSKDDIRIALKTCPFVKDISLLVIDEEALFALSDFQNLKSLFLTWPYDTYGSFIPKTQILLKEIGFKLNKLDICRIDNVDFSVIGMCCPNLHVLEVREYKSEHSHLDFTPAFFQNLNCLCLNNSAVGSILLAAILSNCTKLEVLDLALAEGLDDSTLRKILNKNRFPELKNVKIKGSFLSSTGIQDLASNLTYLEYLQIHSELVLFENIVSIFHTINPKVFLRRFIWLKF